MAVFKDINSSVRIGGSLTLPAGSITLSNIELNHTNGKITATSFAGNGSQLTNLSSAAMTDVLKLDGSRNMTGHLGTLGHQIRLRGNGDENHHIAWTLNDYSGIQLDGVRIRGGQGVEIAAGAKQAALFKSSLAIINAPLTVTTSVTSTTINATGNLQEGGVNLSAKYEPIGTLHDDRYYTETEVDTKLGTKSDAGHTHAFSELTSKPTTVAGYGITDASLSGHTHTFSELTNKPTTLEGFGITDASHLSHLHDDRYLQLTGGDLSGALSINSVNDARLLLNADTDNDTAEGGEPKVVFTQDGGIMGAEIKMAQGGAADNAMVLAPFVDYNTATPIKNYNVFVHDKKIWHEGSFDPNTKVDKTTSIIAGTGLSGGGSLSTDRTLTVKYGTIAGTAAEGNHLHDDRYYTESEMDTKLAGKSDTSHLHDDRYYTETEIDSKISTINTSIGTKSDKGHTHTFSELTDKPTTLSGYGITDAATSTHNHDTSYLKLSGGTLTSNLVMDSVTYTTETVRTPSLVFNTSSDPMRIYGEQYASNQSRLVIESSDDGGETDYVTIRNNHYSYGDVDIMDFFRTHADANVLLNAKNGLSVTGDIVVSGVVDGVDISSFKSSYDNHVSDYLNLKSSHSSHLESFNNYKMTPPAPTQLELIEIDDEVQITFALPSRTSITHYEVWSSVGADNNYGLMSVVQDSDILSTDTTLSVLDNTYDRKTTIYYKVYAVNHSTKSLALEGSIGLVNTVSDPANMSIAQGLYDLTVQYEIPNDRRLDHIEVYMHASTDIAALSEANSILVYSGLSDTFVYRIPGTDLNKYHQFWVSSITRS